MAKFMDRIKQSISILTTTGEEPPKIAEVRPDEGISSWGPSSASYGRITYDSNQAVLAPIVSRISVDVASVPIRHCTVDRFHRFVGLKQSELDDRLSVRANLDQSGAAFIQDAVETMLTTGSCVLVPVDINTSPNSGDSFDILSIRVGSVVEWKNKSVVVSVYNENTGQRQEVTLKKDFVAIAYNPLYRVMNETNSTLRRLVDRLALLDMADGKLFSPGLDLIVQLPYTLKTERRKEEADRRITAIEEQLEDSKRGIAYIDATEKVTQLNRPVTNTLFETVKQLQESLHSQLGLTPSVFSGTASQEEMLSYNNRTILPIIKALTDAMVGSFLSRTAISQGQWVLGLPDLFKMAPIGVIAEAADKLTRNEIMTSNEIRKAIGLPPSNDPEADTLRNKNLNKSDNPSSQEELMTQPPEESPPQQPPQTPEQGEAPPDGEQPVEEPEPEVVESTTGEDTTASDHYIADPDIEIEDILKMPGLHPAARKILEKKGKTS